MNIEDYVVPVLDIPANEFDENKEYIENEKHRLLKKGCELALVKVEDPKYYNRKRIFLLRKPTKKDRIRCENQQMTLKRAYETIYKILENVKEEDVIWTAEAKNA